MITQDICQKSRYMEDVYKIPLLTSERELELATTIQKFKTGKLREKAIEELVKHNLKLVIKEAYSYLKRVGTNFDVEDLISCGNGGLMTAAGKFNPKKFKTKFSTYATFWIREAIQDYIYKNGNVLTIPVHISNGISRHRKIKDVNKNISDKKLKKELKVSDSGLKRILEADVKMVSIDQKIDEDEDKTIGEVISDGKVISPSEQASDNDDYAILYAALDELDETSRNIVISQCLNPDKIQLKKLGKQYKLTGERIRQIREKTLAKLRKRMIKRLDKKV